MNSWLFTHFGCASPPFLGFPTWYKYITDPTTCQATITGINDIWLIVAAVVEILLYLAGLVAVVMVIWGGFEFMTSQAEPAKTTKARQTIISALAGLAIAISASAIINFIAGSIK